MRGLRPPFMESPMAKNDNRRSIYCGPPIQDLLAAVGDDAFSQTLNGSVERYLAVCKAHRPALSRAEWMALCDVFNGTILDANAIKFAGRFLALEMEDGIRLDGLDQKWGIDSTALLAKLQPLTLAETCAVVHVVEVFWAHSASAEADTALNLALA